MEGASPVFAGWLQSVLFPSAPEDDVLQWSEFLTEGGGFGMSLWDVVADHGERSKSEHCLLDAYGRPVHVYSSPA
jgi:hypothetical protein